MKILRKMKEKVMDKDFEKLINEAKKLAKKTRLSEYGFMGHCRLCFINK